ncbi:hypothetical protein ACJJI3_19595 [Microbulbifer sp. ZKSA004]|uniref:hypothetical protein n=1 Tax=Microbulbifer sp. ZKSA004 TaxID=3243389 RepID=UPI00403A3A1B
MGRKYFVLLLIILMGGVISWGFMYETKVRQKAAPENQEAVHLEPSTGSHPEEPSFIKNKEPFLDAKRHKETLSEKDKGLGVADTPANLGSNPEKDVTSITRMKEVKPDNSFIGRYKLTQASEDNDQS